MDEYTKNVILNITNKMMSYNIAKIFCVPIDITLDDFIEYGQKVEHPIDLLTIKNQIINGHYTSHETWKHDINLVFDNAIFYYGKTSIITLLAIQMKQWLNILLEKYPLTPDKWEDSVEKNVLNLIKSLNECKNTKHSLAGKIQQIVNPRQTAAEEYVPPSFAESDYDDKNDSMDDFMTKEEEKIQTVKSKSLKAVSVSDFDKRRITKAINAITDEKTLMDVLTLIQQSEPNLGVNEDSIVYINHLKASTLFDLKKQLQIL